MGPMHKHTADQLFYCVQGECTYHFPNGDTEVLGPGMVVTIPKGQLYQLHNTGQNAHGITWQLGQPVQRCSRHTPRAADAQGACGVDRRFFGYARYTLG